MRPNICLPPEWLPIALVCPKCSAQLRARFSPNNGALEALRCDGCTWNENYVTIAAERNARLLRIRRTSKSSKDRQTSFPK